MSYALNWRARVREGIVQYNYGMTATRGQRISEVSGCHGGDFASLTGLGYPTSVADGGNFGTMAAVENAYPAAADGGEFTL